jgi:hypothetical protein
LRAAREAVAAEPVPLGLMVVILMVVLEVSALFRPLLLRLLLPAHLLGK